MQNNWRSTHNSKLKSANFTVKRSEVIWNKRRDEVFAEIAKLLHVRSADASTPGWFNMRMRALHNVHSHMTEEERLELDTEVARIAEEGYSEEQKRR